MTFERVRPNVFVEGKIERRNNCFFDRRSTRILVARNVDFSSNRRFQSTVVTWKIFLIAEFLTGDPFLLIFEDRQELRNAITRRILYLFDRNESRITVIPSKIQNIYRILSDPWFDDAIIIAAHVHAIDTIKKKKNTRALCFDKFLITNSSHYKRAYDTITVYRVK